MSYLSYVMFIFSLSSLSLFGLILFNILEKIKIASNQKIYILKINLIFIAVSPLFYILYKNIYWNTYSIKFSNMQIYHNVNNLFMFTTSTENNDWAFYIFIIYLAGLIIMLAKIALSYLNAKKILKDSEPSNIQGEIIFINKKISTPLCFGIFKQNIYFPLQATKNFTKKQFQMSLFHEKTHINQNDMLWKLFSLIIQAVLFFAPWSYIIHKKLELEMEIICDEKTCNNINFNANEYGSFLLEMNNFEQNSICSNLATSTLKRRILHMKSKKIKRPLLVWIFGIMLIFMNSITLATSTGITEKKTVFDVQSKIFIDNKLISSPRIVAKANQVSAISISNNAATSVLKMKLIATDHNKNTIAIKFDVQYKNGNEKFHSTPELILSPNQEKTIKLSFNSDHLFEMHVLAKRT